MDYCAGAPRARTWAVARHAGVPNLFEQLLNAFFVATLLLIPLPTLPIPFPGECLVEQLLPEGGCSKESACLQCAFAPLAGARRRQRRTSSMVHGKNRIPYWIDRRLTGLAGPDDDATISFGLPFEPEDSQYGKYRPTMLDSPPFYRPESPPRPQAPAHGRSIPRNAAGLRLHAAPRRWPA